MPSGPGGEEPGVHLPGQRFPHPPSPRGFGWEEHSHASAAFSPNRQPTYQSNDSILNYTSGGKASFAFTFTKLTSGARDLSSFVHQPPTVRVPTPTRSTTSPSREVMVLFCPFGSLLWQSAERLFVYQSFFTPLPSRSLLPCSQVSYKVNGIVQSGRSCCRCAVCV